jgi:hypothetical protein
VPAFGRSRTENGLCFPPTIPSRSVSSSRAIREIGKHSSPYLADGDSARSQTSLRRIGNPRVAHLNDPTKYCRSQTRLCAESVKINDVRQRISRSIGFLFSEDRATIKLLPRFISIPLIETRKSALRGRRGRRFNSRACRSIDRSILDVRVFSREDAKYVLATTFSKPKRVRAGD